MDSRLILVVLYYRVVKVYFQYHCAQNIIKGHNDYVTKYIRFAFSRFLLSDNKIKKEIPAKPIILANNEIRM